MDLTQDAIKLYSIAQEANETAALILGAGLVKHHILEANSLRGGVNYCVLINNGLVYDGSDSGADWLTEESQRRI